MKSRSELKLLGLCLFLSTCIFEALHADCVSPPSGLIAWWRAENNALDQVGTNHGVMNDGATFASGKVGTSFLFDGVNDSMSVANSLVFSNLPQISFSVWFKFNSLPPGKWQMIITKGRVTGPNSNCFWLFRDAATGQLTAGVETAAGLCSVGTALSFNETDQFHLAIVTYDGAQVIFHLDGTSISTNFITGNLRTDSDPVFLGRRNGEGVDGVGDVMNGLVDEAAVFNRAFTTQEAQALYEAGSAGMCVTPSLTIFRAATNMAVVSWPSPSTDFGLQQNTNSLSSVNWGNVTTTPTDTGTNKFVIVDPLTGNRFYRLFKP